MSTPRKQWNPDTTEAELEESQKKDLDRQRQDPRERPELYKKPADRVVTSEPGRRPARKDP